MSSSQPQAKKAFSGFVLDLQRGTLTQGGRAIPLRPKTFAVLAYFVDHPNRLISKEELIETIWPDSVVTDDSVTHCVLEIRKALGDRNRQLLRTVPKRGFTLDTTVIDGSTTTQTPTKILAVGLIFVAFVVGCSVATLVVARVAGLSVDSLLVPPWITRVIILVLIVGFPISLFFSRTIDPPSHSNEPTEASAPKGNPSAGTRWMLAGAAAVLVSSILTVVSLWPAVSTIERSVAVLPLDDVSPGGDQAYLGNGIADELRLELLRLEGLRVASRTSSSAVADQDSQTIGDQLNVDSILEGSVRKDGNRVRIAVQLINAADGLLLWSQRYDRELNQIFEMQEEIATEVAAKLGVTLGVGGINAFRGAGTRNVEAYEAYLRARGNRYTDMGARAAIPFLKRAVELDPKYAVAWSELALKEYTGVWSASVDERPAIAERARKLAQRAVELDPESADVKSAFAMISFGQFDWITAEQNNAQAIELLADRITIDRYALMLMRAGRMTNAEQQFHAAVDAEGVDGRTHPQIWHVYLAQGRFSEAQQILDFRQSSDLHKDSLDVAFSQGDPEKIRAAIRAYPGSDQAYSVLYGPVLSEFDSPDRVYSVLREVYTNQDLQWPRKLHDIATVAAYFGYADFALEVKGRELRVGPLRLTSVFYPVMSEVRRLPGFKQLMTDLNLVDYWRAYGWADTCAPLDDNDFTCS